MLEPKGKLSMRRQCQLLGVNRSSLYYVPQGESAENLELMRLIDIKHLKSPFYGTRRMMKHLRRNGYPKVGRIRVRRLMRLMGIEAIYPKRKLSIRNEEHEIYPYLLRGLEINRPNQVWATDITYIRMRHGFMYLVAIMDWYSRKVLSWRLSNTLDTRFCLEALQEALERYPHPEIFNMDQGCQFTSARFIDALKSDSDIRISMDGRGRAFDNIFTERLWRTVKYEEVFLYDYRNGSEAEQGLAKYFEFYNTERLHQSLDYNTPDEVYGGFELSTALNISIKDIHKAA
jgi:putative transposase